jgi:hypothetical protein
MTRSQCDDAKLLSDGFRTLLALDILPLHPRGLSLSRREFSQCLSQKYEMCFQFLDKSLNITHTLAAQTQLKFSQGLRYLRYKFPRISMYGFTSTRKSSNFARSNFVSGLPLPVIFFSASTIPGLLSGFLGFSSGK